jgi:hypothetical protein
VKCEACLHRGDHRHTDRRTLLSLVPDRHVTRQVRESEVTREKELALLVSTEEWYGDRRYARLPHPVVARSGADEVVIA